MKKIIAIVLAALILTTLGLSVFGEGGPEKAERTKKEQGQQLPQEIRDKLSAIRELSQENMALRKQLGLVYRALHEKHDDIRRQLLESLKERKNNMEELKARRMEELKAVQEQQQAKNIRTWAFTERESEKQIIASIREQLKRTKEELAAKVREAREPYGLDLPGDYIRNLRADAKESMESGDYEALSAILDNMIDWFTRQNEYLRSLIEYR